MTICDAIRLVVEARQCHRTLKTQVQTLKQEFAVCHAALFKEEALGKEAVIEAEATLRELAFEIYQRTGQKTVHPGVKIREVPQLGVAAASGRKFTVAGMASSQTAYFLSNPG